MSAAYSKSLKSCNSIADLRLLALKKLPRIMFDYIDGAAEDEVTLTRNSSDFLDYDLIPKSLVDVAEVNLATTIQGYPSSLPLVLSPTGGTRLFHHQGELAPASVAAKEQLIYTLSTMSTYDIETVGKHTQGHKWFQVYVWKDRAVVKELIERARASGYSALCLTVDVQTSGLRERDVRNGLTVPPRFTASSLFDMALHPGWWFNMLTRPPITMANMIGKAGMGSNSATALGQYAASQLDPSVTWDDMAWMIEQWGGPFMIKGLVSPDDARRAVETGVTGIIISNHGGRQLDHAISPIAALPAIAEQVAGRTQLLLDGGVRRGSDIIKALALGADACMIGRPYLYGLAAGGEPGVSRAIEILKTELKRSMMLLGCTDIHALNKEYLRRRNPS